MTEKGELSTQGKILVSAKKLFSEAGYEGTSIRQIAQLAGVNVASINYHFKTKHELYWAVFRDARDSLEQGIAEIAARSKSLKELALGIFNHLCEREDELRNTFRLLMLNVVPEGSPFKEGEEEPGPPGQKYLASMLSKELGPLSETDRHWAVRVVFSQIVHWALFSKTCHGIKLQQNPRAVGYDHASFEQSIARITESVVGHLQSPPS